MPVSTTANDAGPKQPATDSKRTSTEGRHEFTWGPSSVAISNALRWVAVGP